MRQTMLLALALGVSMAQADGGWLHESGEVEAIFYTNAMEIFSR